MGPSKRRIYRHDEASSRSFNYSHSSGGSGRTEGAFRAISVKRLLRKPPEIALYEWQNVQFPLSKPNPLGKINYVAVSHVWDESSEVKSIIASKRKRPLLVDTGDPSPHQISWWGLVDVAHAALELRAEYVWIDFFCLDQIDRGDNDKALQICMMADIYRKAKYVVVMVGGMSAVQGVANHTMWMDRAWTLQEAILNRKHTYVYVEWAPPPSPKDSKGKTYKFTPVGKAPGKYLIDIRILLDMVDANFVPPLPKIVILDGVVTGEGPRARHSLRGALSSKKSVRTAAIWRSMMMRRSSQPVDIVYSAMGCFGLQIDPYRKNHDPEYLFNDLARKAAATKGLGPAWLNIEGVAGSKISRNPASRIVPAFPHTSPDKPPTWTAADGTKKGAATFITKLADYVSRFDAIFITHSHPHVISAYMLPLTWGRVIASGKANAKLWTMSGTIYYSSKLDRKSWKNVHAIYIGEVGDMGTGPKAPHKGYYYFLFLKWRGGQWDFYGDGSFRPQGGKWRAPKGRMNRWLFTIGQGAQDRIRRWQAPSAGFWLDQRITNFRHHSYGIVPLKDFLINNSPQRQIVWFGIKYNKPTSPRWARCDVNVDTSKLGQPKFSAVLKYPVPLYLTSCHTNMPPQFVDSYTQWKLTEMGALQMLYSFGGWKKSICAQLAKAGVEGVMIPENKKTPSSITSAPYYVSLRFGRQVIYVQTKPHPKTPRQYTQIYVLPYGGWGGPPLNAPYIIVQQPQQTMTEEEYRNALLRQLGYPNWVVGGNPVVPQLTGSGTISDEAYNAIVRPMGYPGVTRGATVPQPVAASGGFLYTQLPGGWCCPCPY